MSDQAQEKKSTAKPIGGIEQYATIGGGGKRSDASTSGSSDLRNVRPLDAQTSRLPKVERKQHTVYLSQGMSKWIKRQAIDEEREISMIVEQALEEYRTKLAQPSPAPVEQKRAEVEALPVPGDLVSLQEFAVLHAVNRNEAERLWKTGMIAGTRQTPGATRYHGKAWPVMLGAKGRRDFWVQFHETPGFRACDDCPHK